MTLNVSLPLSQAVSSLVPQSREHTWPQFPYQVQPIKTADAGTFCTLDCCALGAHVVGEGFPEPGPVVGDTGQLRNLTAPSGASQTRGGDQQRMGRLTSTGKGWCGQGMCRGSTRTPGWMAGCLAFPAPKGIHSSRGSCAQDTSQISFTCPLVLPGLCRALGLHGQEMACAKHLSGLGAVPGTHCPEFSEACVIQMGQMAWVGAHEPQTPHQHHNTSIMSSELASTVTPPP
jgi:hypothetical protein